MDVGQPELASLELERQSFVINAEQMQHRGVQIVNVDAILDDVVSELVGLTVGRSGIHTAAGHPQREAARMVIAAEVVCLRASPGNSSSDRIRLPR